MSCYTADELIPALDVLMRHRPLSAASLAVLLILEDDGKQTMGQLTGLCHFTTSAMTGTVDHLETSKMVERVHDEADRRIVYVQLTEHGKRELSHITKKP